MQHVNFVNQHLQTSPLAQSIPYFGCPRTKAFWYQVFSYVQKIEPEFYQEITFMTVISLGLHNMNPNIRRPDTLVNAIHNIIGLGILVLTTYPIESAESIESTFTRSTVSSLKISFPNSYVPKQKATSKITALTQIFSLRAEPHLPLNQRCGCYLWIIPLHQYCFRLRRITHTAIHFNSLTDISSTVSS